MSLAIVSEARSMKASTGERRRFALLAPPPGLRRTAAIRDIVRLPYREGSSCRTW
jgi:hypothetical protein